MTALEQFKELFREIPKALNSFTLGISYEDDKRIDEVCKIVLLPKHEVIAWATNKLLTWQDIYEFAARYGDLPSNEEADFIYKFGLSIFVRLKKKHRSIDMLNNMKNKP